MFAVKVVANTELPGCRAKVVNVPVLVLKYSPLKPKVTSLDTANCGYKATPVKPPVPTASRQV
jgi:hypothetical protein